MAAVMAGEVPGRIPYSLPAPSRFWDALRDELGREPGEVYHLDIGCRGVAMKVLGKPPWNLPFDEPPDDPEQERVLRDRFRGYLPDTDARGARVTEYGCMTVPGSMYHLRQLIYPMERMTSPDELADYPFPDLTESWRWEGVAEQAAELLAEGYWVSAAVGSIFESSWFVRGQERLLLDLYENPDLATALLDRMMNDRIYLAKRFAEMGVDCVAIGDDMGVQHGLIMSLPMLRKWILSRYERVIAEARALKPDICVDFHTDGRMQEAIPDMMAIGVTAINPVQPECDDPEFLKQTFGRKLVLKGTLSSRTLTFGTPGDIRAEIEVRMDTGRRWGGLMLTPNNAPDVNTPFKNFRAFLDAAEEYGHIE